MADLPVQSFPILNAAQSNPYAGAVQSGLNTYQNMVKSQYAPQAAQADIMQKSAQAAYMPYQIKAAMLKNPALVAYLADTNQLGSFLQSFSNMPTNSIDALNQAWAGGGGGGSPGGGLLNSLARWLHPDNTAGGSPGGGGGYGGGVPPSAPTDNQTQQPSPDGQGGGAPTQPIGPPDSTGVTAGGGPIRSPSGVPLPGGAPGINPNSNAYQYDAKGNNIKVSPQEALAILNARNRVAQAQSSAQGNAQLSQTQSAALPTGEDPGLTQGGGGGLPTAPPAPAFQGSQGNSGYFQSMMQQQYPRTPAAQASAATGAGLTTGATTTSSLAANKLQEVTNQAQQDATLGPAIMRDTQDFDTTYKHSWLVGPRAFPFAKKFGYDSSALEKKSKAIQSDVGGVGISGITGQPTDFKLGLIGDTKPSGELPPKQEQQFVNKHVAIGQRLSDHIGFNQYLNAKLGRKATGNEAADAWAQYGAYMPAYDGKAESPIPENENYRAFIDSYIGGKPIINQHYNDYKGGTPFFHNGIKMIRKDGKYYHARF